MKPAIILIILLCVCVIISSSVGGILYINSSSPEPAPGPAPGPDKEILLKSGEECTDLPDKCESGLLCVKTSDDGKKYCYSMSECRDKIIENNFFRHDRTCGKSGCMNEEAPNYNPDATFEIPGSCITSEICDKADINNDGVNSTNDIMAILGYYGMRCNEITDNDKIRDLCFSLQPEVPEPDAELEEDMLNTTLAAFDCSN